MDVTYEEAFRAYYWGIVRYCLSEIPNDPYCAEDLASECFLLLYRKWDDLQSHAPMTVQVWLFRTARNKVLDCKKKKRLHTVSLDDESERNRLESEARPAFGRFCTEGNGSEGLWGFRSVSGYRNCPDDGE